MWKVHRHRYIYKVNEETLYKDTKQLLKRFRKRKILFVFSFVVSDNIIWVEFTKLQWKLLNSGWILDVKWWTGAKCCPTPDIITWYMSHRLAIQLYTWLWGHELMTQSSPGPPVELETKVKTIISLVKTVQGVLLHVITLGRECAKSRAARAWWSASIMFRYLTLASDF